MPQKITGPGFRPTEATGARETARPARTQTSEAATSQTRPAARDTVEIGSAELINRLDAALKSASGVDAARVQAVRDAIASGAYEVDSEAIADKLIRLERELNY